MQILNYTTFGLPMIICFGVAASLILRKNRTREHSILGLSFALLTVACFIMMCYSIGLWISSPALDIFSIITPLASSAVFYLYVISVTNPAGIKRKHYYIFVPTIVLTSANIIVDLLLGPSRAAEIVTLILSSNIYSLKLTNLELFKVILDSNCLRGLVFLQTIGVVLYGQLRFSDYLKSLTKYYSNKGGAFIDTEWKLSLSAEVLALSMGLMCVVPFHTLSRFTVVMIVMSILFSVSVAMIGIEGHLLKGNAREFQKLIDMENKIKAEEAMTQDVPVKKYIEKIRGGLEKFIQDKGYLDPNITAEDLADRLKTNRYYLSETLKALYKESFATFVNKRRIDYAQHLIASATDEDAIMKRVAIESGYNNFVNFYRNFVKFSGMSPTDWAKAHRNPSSEMKEDTVA